MDSRLARQTFIPIEGESRWLRVRDANRSARQLFDRHYSRRRKRIGVDGKFVGPGEHIVLITPDALAIFVWRKFIDDTGQTGINCAVFRNEGPTLSSELVLEAMSIAWERWPSQRLYTYVDPKRIKSGNPGFCFKRAGWQKCGVTKGGLHILEAHPLTLG